MISTAELLHDLVIRPSVNPMGRIVEGGPYFETRVTAYLEEFFRGLGVRYERQTIAEGRDNIVAFSDLPAPRGTVLMEAHQDTVPIDNMVIDPFCGKIEDGRLYGRGSCDIKGGLAAMLACFARIVRERPASAANVIMACTVDEEHTFLGVQRLMRDGLKAEMAVVAEPTRLHIVNAHKGVVRWFLDASGRACHSSAPEQGVNAIYNMAGLLIAVQQFAEWLRTSRIDPVLGPATLSVGIIEGGSSVNTVPDRCRVQVDRRLIPGEDPQHAPDELAAYLKEAVQGEVPFECSRPWLYTPALSTEGSAEVVARLGHAIDRVRGGHEVHAVPYGTDASTIALAGTPAVVFGPGDIARAHTCDEWVPLDEVDAAAEILYRFVCSP